MSGPWVGFDFDGTLVDYPAPGQSYGKDHGNVVGLLRFIKDAGTSVKVMTARAAHPQTKQIIQSWLDNHGLSEVEITDKKDFDMLALIDDLAITVDSVTGEFSTMLPIANRILSRARVQLTNG